MKERHKFYSTTEWRKLSKSIRAANPVCESCKRELTQDLDHHLEISLDKDHKYSTDPNNLVSLCKRCHWKKSRTFQALVAGGDLNRLYLWLYNTHPRKEDRHYLNEWIKNAKDLPNKPKRVIQAVPRKAYSEETK